MTPDQWRERIGKPVEARRLELRLYTMVAASTQARVSESAWRQIERGNRTVNGATVIPSPLPRTLGRIGDVLGWERDWLERLAAGKKPTPLRQLSVAPEPEVSNADLLEAIRALGQQLQSLTDAILRTR